MAAKIAESDRELHRGKKPMPDDSVTHEEAACKFAEFLQSSEKRWYHVDMLPRP